MGNAADASPLAFRNFSPSPQLTASRFPAPHTLGAPYSRPQTFPTRLWDTASLDVPRRGLWAPEKVAHRAASEGN